MYIQNIIQYSNSLTLVRVKLEGLRQQDVFNALLSFPYTLECVLLCCHFV